MTDPLRVGLVLDDPGIQLQVLDWIRELHGSDGIQSLTPNVITPRWTAASGGVIDFLVCDTLDTIKNSHSVLGTCSPSSFVVIGPPISESRLFPFFAQGLVDAVINADLSKQRISIWLGQA